MTDKNESGGKKTGPAQAFIADCLQQIKAQEGGQAATGHTCTPAIQITVHAGNVAMITNSGPIYMARPEI